MSNWECGVTEPCFMDVMSWRPQKKTNSSTVKECMSVWMCFLVCFYFCGQKILNVCHSSSIKAISPSVLLCWVCGSLYFRSSLCGCGGDVGVQCGCRGRWCCWGGGLPPELSLSPGLGVRGAVMTASLCGRWRGPISLKSLVWQASGLCVRAGVRVCALSVDTPACAPVWLYIRVCVRGFTLSQRRGGQPQSTSEIATSAKHFYTCRQSWKQEKQQGENCLHLSLSSACLILFGGFSRLIKAGCWWE